MRISVLLLFFSFLCFSQHIKDQAFQLSSEEFAQLKDFLLHKNIPIKDTIIIKYEFNGDDCWHLLNQKSKNYIHKVRDGMQKHISNFNLSHSDAIAIRVKESGKNFSDYILDDPTILTDDDKLLRRLLFKKTESCGTTAVILDDASFALKESDSHFSVLNILNNKQTITEHKSKTSNVK